MAEETLVLNAQNTAADTIESFYDSPANGAGTSILAFTASNDTEASVSYKAYIFDSSGDPVKAIIPQKIVVRDRFDLGVSTITHRIPAGGSLRMESSTAESLSFTVTGDPQT